MNHKKILIISDLHIPYHHKDSFDFLREIKKEFKPDTVINIGDSLDFHAISMHSHDPDLFSAGHELKEARRYVQTGNVTGLTPLIGEYIRKAKAFVGAGGKKLTDREIAKNLINDIINGNIKELTGESGRTISNLDRQVAANLIGAIDWKADQATVLQKLELAEERARKKKENSYKNYLAARKPFENAGYKVPSRFDILSQQIQPEGERIRLQLR